MEVKLADEKTLNQLSKWIFLTIVVGSILAIGMHHTVPRYHPFGNPSISIPRDYTFTIPKIKTATPIWMFKATGMQDPRNISLAKGKRFMPDGRSLKSPWSKNKNLDWYTLQPSFSCAKQVALLTSDYGFVNIVSVHPEFITAVFGCDLKYYGKIGMFYTIPVSRHTPDSEEISHVIDFLAKR